MKKWLASLLILAMLVPFASCGNGDDSSSDSSSSETPASSSEKQSSEETSEKDSSSEIDILEVHDTYRIAFLADTHLYDQEGMFGMTSAERTEMAVQCVIKENDVNPIDLVVFPGDNVNNNRYEYSAGTFDSWDDFECEGEYYSSKYKGVKYSRGSSGTKDDPLGVLRILSYVELLEPLTEAGIRYIITNGNHDCYRDEIFELGYKMNHMPGYIEAAKHYPTDEDGNITVKDWTISQMKFSIIDRVVTPDDPEYEYYAKGYGQNYTFAFDYDTAFVVFDAYHCEGVTDTATGKWEESGFVSNASGRSWPACEITASLVSQMMETVEDYEEIFFVLHCAGDEVAEKQTALRAELKDNPKVLAVFDGHTHMETTTFNLMNTGKPRFTCGYFGIPMYERQALFPDEPFSYRMLEKKDNALVTYIALVEHDYPDYVFWNSSKASVKGFFQEYTTRGLTRIKSYE